MNKSNNYVQLSLFSVIVLLFGMFVFSSVYAETVSITTPISPITILSDEFIALLDTSTTGNLTSVSITANLPCNSSNNPLLTIVAGIFGDTVNIIDSSSDFVGNGPRDTCVFRDNITNVTAANIPAINSVFLNHTGSSPVHIPQGVMVTLSGVFENQISDMSSPPSSSFPVDIDFTEYFSEADTHVYWPSTDETDFDVNLTNDNIDVNIDGDAVAATTIHYDFGSALDSTNWVAEWDVDYTTITAESTGSKSFYWMTKLSSTSSTGETPTGSNELELLHVKDAGSCQSLEYKTVAGIQSDAGGITYCPIADHLWYRMLNVGGLITMSYYTDSTRTTAIGTSNAITDTMDDLQYFKFQFRQDTGGNGAVVGVFDNLKVCSGVTSISACT